MTKRAAVLGLIVVLAIAFGDYFINAVTRSESFISDLLPPGIYGPLIIVLLFVNPLLKRIKPSWSLRGGEIATILMMAMLAGAAVNAGLIKSMPPSAMLPHHHARIKPGWAREQVVALAPSRAMADVSRDSNIVLDGYVAGLGEGERHIAVTEVPWHAWIRPMAFWLPFLLSATFGLLGLAVVLHRQWACHEKLPYPTVTFAQALLPVENRPLGAVFYNRIFWCAAIPILAIHLNNYLCRWWPGNLIPVRLYLDFSPLAETWETFAKGGGTLMLRPRIMFAVIGIAYFIASDVALSMGLMPYFFCLFVGWLTSYGVVLRAGNHMALKYDSFLFFGGYLAIFTMLAYTGRRYYLGVFKAAFRKTCALGDVAPHEAWCMRLFLVCSALVIAQLTVLGLSLPLALAYAAMALVTAVVVSRTIAETGAFYIGTEIFPGGLLWGFIGAAAISPAQLAIVYLLTAVCLATPGWGPMPFAVQAFQLVDLSGERVARAVKWALLATVIAAVVALPVIIYWQYDRGANLIVNSWLKALTEMPGDNLVEMKQTLRATGMLEASENARGLERLFLIRPHWSYVFAFVVAFGTAILFGVCRLRFAWWPLHPVVFVFLNGHQGRNMAFSFLLGWLIKVTVSRYGGPHLYQKLKPFMIGIIAADLLGRFIPMLVGILYYAATGRQPF